MIILFFGQPASGKTTLADELYSKTWSDTFGAVIRIDGDKWRDVTKNKDYSKEGRIRNLKGAFDMALYLEKEGYIPILSFVTPYSELRNYLKENSYELFQIYLEYNEDRGRNMNFAKDFEIPDGKYLSINTSEKSIDECISEIMDFVVVKKEKPGIDHLKAKWSEICPCNIKNGGDGECTCSMPDRIVDKYTITTNKNVDVTNTI